VRESGEPAGDKAEFMRPCGCEAANIGRKAQGGVAITALMAGISQRVCEPAVIKVGATA